MMYWAKLSSSSIGSGFSAHLYLAANYRGHHQTSARPPDVLVGVAEAADLERTVLRVQRELVKDHFTASGDCESLREGDEAIGRDSDKPVGHSDLVQVRVLQDTQS